MAVSATHRGWRFDRENARLDFFFNGTRAGHITATGLTTTGSFTLTDSVDSAAVADQVSIGGFELSAGNRALAWSQEAVVVTAVTEADYSHAVPVRINGVTFNIMMASTLS